MNGLAPGVSRRLFREEEAVALVFDEGRFVHRLGCFFDEELTAGVASVGSLGVFVAPVVEFVALSGLRLVQFHLAAADDVVARRVAIAHSPAAGGLCGDGGDLGVIGCCRVEVGVVGAVDDVVGAIVAAHELPHGAGVGGGCVGADHAGGAALRGDVVVVGAEGVKLIPVLVALGAGGGLVQRLSHGGAQGACHVGGFCFGDGGLSQQRVGFFCLGVEGCHAGFAILSHAAADVDNVSGGQCLTDAVAQVGLCDAVGGFFFSNHVEGQIRHIGK